jgi:large conductance mechanosensitive channel
MKRPRRCVVGMRTAAAVLPRKGVGSHPAGRLRAGVGPRNLFKEGNVFKEFKEFAMRGSVLDMAVGIIIGAAFGTIVSSLVADVLMPPVGLLLGNVDFSNLFVVLKAGQAAGPYLSMQAAKDAGAVTLNYGLFINHIISFLIVAFALFLVIRSMNRLKKKSEAAPAAPTTKDCPFCSTAIPIKAVRCPHCTSELGTQK